MSNIINLTPWRNGSASDSRSEGCVFESRRGHKYFACFLQEFSPNDDITVAAIKYWSVSKNIFCLQWGLNSWPLVYKTNALPLSYRGLLVHRWNFESLHDPENSCAGLYHLPASASQDIVGLNGLGVWFSLWVREVPGSNPGWALCFVPVQTKYFHTSSACDNRLQF